MTEKFTMRKDYRVKMQESGPQNQEEAGGDRG